MNLWYICSAWKLQWEESTNTKWKKKHTRSPLALEKKTKWSFQLFRNFHSPGRIVSTQLNLRVEKVFTENDGILLQHSLWNLCMIWEVVSGEEPFPKSRLGFQDHVLLFLLHSLKLTASLHQFSGAHLLLVSGRLNFIINKNEHLKSWKPKINLALACTMNC